MSGHHPSSAAIESALLSGLPTLGQARDGLIRSFRRQPAITAVAALAILQIACAQYFFLTLGLFVSDPRSAVTAATSTRYTDFVRAHLPPGATVLYVSSKAAPPITHRLLSYDLPHSQVLWVVVPTTGVATEDLLVTAHRDGASFMAFYDVPTPTDLPTRASWQLEPGFSLVEVGS